MKLKFIRSISWEEVFLLWKNEEAELPHWIEHYRKRGFRSWDDWRTNSVKDIYPDELKWNLFELSAPLETAPKFRAGPFRAWIKKYYRGEETRSFAELAEEPDIQNDPKINEIIRNFPKSSVLIGLKKDDDIIIIEGMHRCCALSVARRNGIAVDARVFIACAEFSEELPFLGNENSPT